MLSITITRSGQLEVYTPGGTSPNFTADLTFAGTRVTIGEVPICATKGRYAWSASGRTLRLRVLADKACPARVALFGGVWTRK